MKKLLLTALVLVLVVFVVVVGGVNGIALVTAAEAEPEFSETSSGSSRSSEETSAAGDAMGESARLIAGMASTTRPTELQPPGSAQIDPLAYEKGLSALRRGDDAEALAYLSRIPPEHPRYAKAMRFVGWEIYGRVRGEHRRGVRYVNRALLAAPLDGNVWQDLARTYAGTLGIDL